jgi:hypothetical protein
MFTDDFNTAMSIFNQDMAVWDIRSACDIRRMFLFASDFNQDMNSWAEKVTTQSLCPENIMLSDIFVGTSCPVQADPLPGPWCQGSEAPSNMPSIRPSGAPSITPSIRPSFRPSRDPSNHPSMAPETEPSLLPSIIPSIHPSVMPSFRPSEAPDRFPYNVKACLRDVFAKTNCGCSKVSGLECFKMTRRTICLKKYNKKIDTNDPDMIESFMTKTEIAYRRECRRQRMMK